MDGLGRSSRAGLDFAQAFIALGQLGRHDFAGQSFRGSGVKLIQAWARQSLVFDHRSLQEQRAAALVASQDKTRPDAERATAAVKAMELARDPVGEILCVARHTVPPLTPPPPYAFTTARYISLRPSPAYLAAAVMSLSGSRYGCAPPLDAAGANRTSDRSL